MIAPPLSLYLAPVTSFDNDFAVAQLASVSSSAVGITDARKQFGNCDRRVGRMALTSAEVVITN
jgi:hypothetical protein